MTAPRLNPAIDLGRFLTPEALAEVRARQGRKEASPLPSVPQAPKGSPLTPERAARLKDGEWRNAFARTSATLIEVLEVHHQADDGTEIAAQILDRLLDLHSYGMALFASPLADPKSVFRAKARETLEGLWSGIHSTVSAALAEAEPILRAEYQEQLDAYLSMIDAANAETTAERRRADAAVQLLSTVKAQQLNELDTAVWRAGQTAKTELKAQERRADAAERHLQDAQTELALLRQEVARLGGRERELTEAGRSLESRLAGAQHTLPMNSFRKEVEVEVPETETTLDVHAPLEGITVAVHLRNSGRHASYDPDTRTVSGPGLTAAVLSAAIESCKAIPDKVAYLRAHLREAGVIA